MDYKVLVTGGSRGIGRAVVELYRENGYEVYAPGRDELDLASKESVDAFIHSHCSECYSIIVNNAGVNHVSSVEMIADDDLSEMLNVNMISPLRLIRGFVPGMKKMHFGRIVNVGSIWGVISKPGRTGYSMTKHGIYGITKTLALELASDGILVNTVAPGQTMTDLTRKNNSVAAIRQMEQDIPLGRLAEPSEIAKAIFYLGNEDNTYITGQELIVDGGLSIQ